MSRKKRAKLTADDAAAATSLIGQAIAGNGRLSDGTTLLEKYPEKYRNKFTDWIDLLIAEVKAKQSLERQKKEEEENCFGKK
jgi:hypothetical protein